MDGSRWRIRDPSDADAGAGTFPAAGAGAPGTARSVAMHPRVG